MLRPLIPTLILVVGIAIGSSTQAVPKLISYQGRLADSLGNGLDTTVSMTFAIHDDSLSGSELWSEIHGSVDVASGLFNVLLGSESALNHEVFANDDLWLSVAVNGEALVSPRTRLTAVAYANRVATVDGAQGGTIMGDVRLQREAAEDHWELRINSEGTLQLFTREDSAIVAIVGNQDLSANLLVDGHCEVLKDLKIEGGISSSSLQAECGGGVVSVNGYAPDSIPSISYGNENTDIVWSTYATRGGNFYILGRGDNGTVGIFGQGEYTADLIVDGQTSTSVLEITGGSDLAEPFSVSDGQILPPGAVAVIDEDNPGHLTLGREPYDTRVAGIVSGAGGVRPGLTLRQDGAVDGDQHVALSGRVYVMANTENGQIRPGDMLTTSSTAGQAMRATDRERSYGAVIGKAMTGLQSGSDLVLVLVGLQ